MREGPIEPQEPGEDGGTPRWVKVTAAVVAVVLLAMLVMMLAGGGHGPSRH